MRRRRSFTWSVVSCRKSTQIDSYWALSVMHLCLLHSDIFILSAFWSSVSVCVLMLTIFIMHIAWLHQGRSSRLLFQAIIIIYRMRWVVHVVDGAYDNTMKLKKRLVSPWNVVHRCVSYSSLIDPLVTSMNGNYILKSWWNRKTKTKTVIKNTFGKYLNNFKSFQTTIMLRRFFKRKMYFEINEKKKLKKKNRVHFSSPSMELLASSWACRWYILIESTVKLRVNSDDEKMSENFKMLSKEIRLRSPKQQKLFPVYQLSSLLRDEILAVFCVARVNFQLSLKLISIIILPYLVNTTTSTSKTTEKKREFSRCSSA